MIVEVDPQTFTLEVRKYVVVHDCGTVINPLILAGHIDGGVAQGIGNAFYEQLIFDDDGQLLNASLADYPSPISLDVPRMDVAARPRRRRSIRSHQGGGEAAPFRSGRCSRRRSRMHWGCWRRTSAQRISAEPEPLFEPTAKPADPATPRRRCDDPGHWSGGQDRQSRGQALAAKGVNVRGLARRPEHAEALRACGAADISIGSFDDPRALAQAAAGICATDQIRPNVNPYEAAYARAVAAAAQAKNVACFVYHSSAPAD